MSERHIKFAPEILARLGEELVPQSDLGIMELVRNAYDADATACRLELSAATEPGGTLIIADDGVGMNEEELASGFLLIGKSDKVERTHTGKKSRRKIGEKGLGRLAALRLGRHAQIESRPESEPGCAYLLIIDWKRYEGVASVEEVTYTIERQQTRLPAGTTITVSDLRHGFTAKEIDDLAHSLLMLTGPFLDKNDFRIECDAPEFAKLATLVNQSWFESAEYRLVATLDKDGHASAELYNWRGQREFYGDHGEVALGRTTATRGKVPICFAAPECVFEMWMFNLRPERSHELRHAQQDTEGIKAWLKEVGGVHIYHRGLRVQPYGDRRDDWLGINLRRAASPEVRPSTNNALGRILTADEKNSLRPKTDRSGFVDNEAFLNLRDFAQRAVDWAAAQRMDKREQLKVAKRIEVRNAAQETESAFQKLVTELKINEEGVIPLDGQAGQEVLEMLADVSRKAIEAQKAETVQLNEDLRLYRSLASVGTSTAVFAHESKRPTSLLINIVDELRELLAGQVSSDVYEQSYLEPLAAAEQSAQAVSTFAELPLSMLQKAKRVPGNIEIDDACRAAAFMYRSFLRERLIEVEFDLSAPGVQVATTVADIESIIGNLLVNAAHALIREDAPDRPRIVRVSTLVEDEETLVLCVDDSGPGIHDMPIREIWLPGRTGIDNGTGLGLTIVRDIVADLGGQHMAYAEGDLGGARFVLRLPIIMLAQNESES